MRKVIARKGISMLLCLFLLGIPVAVRASDGDKLIQIGMGLLYERGMDLTVSVEQETRYHNAWEYFGNVYLKWDECPSCGHVCPESFWKNYRTWGVGAAYKPAVVRGRNTVGRIRLGASAGADGKEFVAGIHAGYEQDYKTRCGLVLFWQVKSDLMINGKDLFRTGIVLGMKFPIN